MSETPSQSSKDLAVDRFRFAVNAIHAVLDRWDAEPALTAPRLSDGDYLRDIARILNR